MFTRLRMLRHRYAVTMRGGEGSFTGVLTRADRRMLVFEDCATIPDRDATAAPIAGRVFIERTRVAYLQEILNVTSD